MLVWIGVRVLLLFVKEVDDIPSVTLFFSDVVTSDGCSSTPGTRRRGNPCNVGSGRLKTNSWSTSFLPVRPPILFSFTGGPKLFCHHRTLDDELYFEGDGSWNRYSRTGHS